MSLHRCDAIVEVKPCLFCGEQPVMENVLDYDRCYPQNRYIVDKVTCQFCKISRCSIKEWNIRVYPHQDCFYDGGRGCNNLRLI